MKVAIASDSHGSLDRLGELMSNLTKAGVDYLVHAGDFVSYEVDEIFRNYPNITTFISRGNCDVNEEVLEKVISLPHVTLDEVIYLELEGVSIAASHIEGIAQRDSAEKNRKVDIFIHGHTHRYKRENRENNLILNPGALCDDGNYLLLSLPDLDSKIKRFDQ